MAFKNEEIADWKNCPCDKQIVRKLISNLVLK